MNFGFDPKNLCKILAHECNHQDYHHTNCPAGARHRCPYKEDAYMPCEDVTWKDWLEFFAKDGKHDVD